MPSIEIFFWSSSRSQEDEALLQSLLRHLQGCRWYNLVSILTDNTIPIGATTKEVHTHYLDSAQIVLLLISPDFPWNDTAAEQQQLQQRYYDQGNVEIVPILLRPFLLDQGNFFAQLQTTLPSNRQSVTSGNWRNTDEAFTDIANDLDRIVREVIITHWLQTAQLLRGMYQYEEALTAYECIIDLDPQCRKALISKTKTLNEIKTRSALKDVYLNKIKEYRSKQSYGDILRYTEEMLHIFPEDAYIHQAEALVHLSHFAEALEACKQAIKRGAKEERVSAYKGLAYLKLREEARKRLLKKLPFAILALCLILVTLTFETFSAYTLIHYRFPVTPTPVPINDLSVVQVPHGLKGQVIGVNDGSLPPFDIGRLDENDKDMAYQALQNGDRDSAQAAWINALKKNSNDAEALIYKENLRVIETKKPYITFAGGMAFLPNFTGPDKESEEMLQGIYVAQKEFNDNNKNKNLQLRILIANVAGPDASYVASVTQQLVHIAKKQNIVAVIDWLTSTDTKVAEPILRAANIPLIAPSATLDDFTNYKKNFFRIVPPDNRQAKLAADYAIHTLHATRALVFIDKNDAYSNEIANDFKEQFTLTGNNTTKDVPFTKGQKDFAPLITQQLESGFDPDIFFFTSPLINDTKNFEDALPTHGPYANVPVMAGSAGYAIEPNIYGRLYFIGLAFADTWEFKFGKEHTNVFFSDYSSDFDPHKQQKAGTYEYNRPPQETILWYDTTNVVLQSVSQWQNGGTAVPTPDNIVNALENITGENAFQGISGQIAFDTDHDPINKALLIMAAPDGHTNELSVDGCYIKGCPP